MIRFLNDVSVELVKHRAADSDVLWAARVSTTGERAALADENEQRDAGLINFLMRDRHGSPFEHISFTFLVKAPIFVAREHMRHRAGWSYNEESGRYRELEPVFYIPARDRKLVQEGRPGEYTFVEGDDRHFSIMQASLKYAYDWAFWCYQNMLKAGIAREVARMSLPVGIFTTYYATCNARSLMHFLSLRTRSEDAKVPSFPQREIEMVAERMETFFQVAMPITHAAFVEHGRVAP